MVLIVKNFTVNLLQQPQVRIRTFVYMSLPKVPGYENIGTDSCNHHTFEDKLADLDRLIRLLLKGTSGFELGLGKKQSYLTQFMFVGVTGSVVDMQATTSRNTVHTHAVTLTKRPHLPREKCLVGRTAEQPLQATIPWGIT